MTVPYNLLAVRKELGSIHHRLAETGLDPAIRTRIIYRHIANLHETLPHKFWGICTRCEGANDAGDTLELVAGLCLIESMLPPLTVGCALQGQVYTVIGDDDTLWRKSKSGRASLISGVLYPHHAADTPIKLVNVTT